MPINHPPDESKARLLEQKTIIVFSFFALIEALYLGIILAYTLYPQYIPPDPNHIFLDHRRGGVSPNREMFLYHFFVVTAIFIQLTGLFLAKPKLKSKTFLQSLTRLTAIESVLLGAVLTILLKISMSGATPVLQCAVISLLTVSGLLKLFWVQLEPLLRPVFEPKPKGGGGLNRALDVIIPLFIIFTIYIPDQAGLEAILYGIDKFFHIDSFVTTAGWAALKGNAINVDTFSIYGVGAPVIIAHLAKAVGAFTYQNVLLVMLCLIIIYYISFYHFVKFWLKNTILAALGVILLLKFQLFNNDPFILLYPSRSAVRFLFDIPFLYFLLKHTQSGQRKDLLWASAVCGVSIFYITDTGIYQLASLYAYLLILLITPHLRATVYKNKKDLKHIVAYAGLAPVVTFVLLWMTIGNHVFGPVFWNNTIGFIKDAQAGYGTVPMTLNIQEEKYVMFLMSCVVPAVYLLTGLILGALCFFNKIKRKHLFVVIVAVYGLLLYRYHVWRSVQTNYYVMCMPYILIICFWIKELLNRESELFQKRTFLVLLGCALLMLFSTKNFLKSPNVLNFRNYNYAENKTFQNADMVLDNDVQMIRELTQPSDKVCLISSFQTRFLMEADRAPLLYQAQSIKSSFLSFSSFEDVTFLLKSDLKHLIDQIEEAKSPYVFLEKKIIVGEKYFPKFYKPGLPMPEILKYLKDNYKITQESNHLAAFKRTSP